MSGEGPTPFVHSIAVRWADCDPARIAYTGRIPYFALDAIDAWWETHAGADWFHMNVDRKVGTPFVHMSLDFTSPVTPRNRLLCEVRLLRLGETSIRFEVTGRQNGIDCFRGEFVEVFVEADSHLKKLKVPAELRERLEALVVARQS
ncbi:MAG: thioesterase family protein [Rhizobiaceae bacterium]